ncbi:unnamed protein product [Linum tenue]|nr:unnamed protein product [Linum tenue]CAI0455955.1 unnamed protein product [Linum tenue]
MQEEGRGGVPAVPVHRRRDELPGVDLLRHADHHPEQRPGRHHQLRRPRPRAHLPLHLRLLRQPQQGPQEGLPRPPRRGRALRRHHRRRPRRLPHPALPQHHRGDRRRRLQHHHVRLPARRHGQGLQDQERGVHAALALRRQLRQRQHLDGLRSHSRDRLVHCGTLR